MLRSPERKALRAFDSLANCIPIHTPWDASGSPPRHLGGLPFLGSNELRDALTVALELAVMRGR